MPQNEESIKDFIKNRFGFGVVDVELTDSQLNHAIGEGKRWFCTYQSQTKFLVIPSVSGDFIDVPEDCDNVVDVLFEDQSIASFFDWAGIGWNAYDPFFGNSSIGGYGNTANAFSDYIMLMQRWEIGRNVLGMDTDWEYSSYDRKIKLYPSAHSVGKNVAIIYSVNAEYLKLEKLHSKFYRLVSEYSYAIAMETLGYIRSKYSDLPSATGTLTLNGDTLLSNAEILRMGLYEQITKIRGVTGFIVR